MAVHVVVNDVAALLTAHIIGQCPQPGDIVTGEESQPVLPCETAPLHDFFFYISVFFRTKQCIPSIGKTWIMAL